MDILQLQYFQTIARLENMTKAAELLYVAQPNLSVSIRRLEEDLGVALFERRKGKIRLTTTGRQFLAYVDDILEELDKAVASARDAGRHADEQVRVASVIVDLIGALLQDFLPENPGISFRQFNCRNSEVVGKIMNAEADFGFVFGAPSSPSIEYIEIDSCERVVQLAKDHPLASRELVSLKELAGQKLILNLSRDDDELIRELSRSRRFRPEVFYECDDKRVEISMITRGGGLSIAPLSNYLKLKNEDPSINMTCLRVREDLPPARLGMVRRTGTHLTKAALQFYETVQQFFRHEQEIAQSYAIHLPPR